MIDNKSEPFVLKKSKNHQKIIRAEDLAFEVEKKEKTKYKNILFLKTYDILLKKKIDPIKLQYLEGMISLREIY